MDNFTFTFNRNTTVEFHTPDKKQEQKRSTKFDLQIIVSYSEFMNWKGIVHGKSWNLLHLVN
jgi:hypothetical protein